MQRRISPLASEWRGPLTMAPAKRSGRRSLKLVQHLETLKTINKARMPPALFIGLSDLHVVKLLFVLTDRQERIPLDDAQFLPFARGKGSDPAN